MVRNKQQNKRDQDDYDWFINNVSAWVRSSPRMYYCSVKSCGRRIWAYQKALFCGWHEETDLDPSEIRQIKSEWEEIYNRFEECGVNFATLTPNVQLYVINWLVLELNDLITYTKRKDKVFPWYSPMLRDGRYFREGDISLKDLVILNWNNLIFEAENYGYNAFLNNLENSVGVNYGHLYIVRKTLRSIVGRLEEEIRSPKIAERKETLDKWVELGEITERERKEIREVAGGSIHAGTSTTLAGFLAYIGGTHVLYVWFTKGRINQEEFDKLKLMVDKQQPFTLMRLREILSKIPDTEGVHRETLEEWRNQRRLDPTQFEELRHNTIIDPQRKYSLPEIYSFLAVPSVWKSIDQFLFRMVSIDVARQLDFYKEVGEYWEVSAIFVTDKAIKNKEGTELKVLVRGMKYGDGTYKTEPEKTEVSIHFYKEHWIFNDKFGIEWDKAEDWFNASAGNVLELKIEKRYIKETDAKKAKSGNFELFIKGGVISIEISDVSAKPIVIKDLEERVKELKEVLEYKDYDKFRDFYKKSASKYDFHQDWSKYLKEWKYLNEVEEESKQPKDEGNLTFSNMKNILENVKYWGDEVDEFSNIKITPSFRLKNKVNEINKKIVDGISLKKYNELGNLVNYWRKRDTYDKYLFDFGLVREENFEVVKDWLLYPYIEAVIGVFIEVEKTNRLWGVEMFMLLNREPIYKAVYKRMEEQISDLSYKYNNKIDGDLRFFRANKDQEEPCPGGCDHENPPKEDQKFLRVVGFLYNDLLFNKHEIKIIEPEKLEYAKDGWNRYLDLAKNPKEELILLVDHRKDIKIEGEKMILKGNFQISKKYHYNI